MCIALKANWKSVHLLQKNMHFSHPVLQGYYQQGTAKDRASQRGANNCMFHNHNTVAC